MQIVGATGRGKTESVILPWFMRDLWHGYSSILMDGKGDKELRNKIYRHARAIKRPLKLVTFDLGDLINSATTNPLKLGTPQQITDRLFAAFEFEDPFYKGVQYDIAGGLVQLIFEVGDVVTFKEIYGLLTDDQLLAGLIAKGKTAGLKRKLIAYSLSG